MALNPMCAVLNADQCIILSKATEAGTKSALGKIVTRMQQLPAHQSLSSWNFVYESRNKSLKAINTNGKTNLELTLLKRRLITAHLEDYVNTLPPVALAPPSADDADFLSSCFRNKNNDNVFQMSESVQNEYPVSICGYEHLPPSAVKSLRFKKYSVFPPVVPVLNIYAPVSFPFNTLSSHQIPQFE
ncbi:hypothetical protein HMPREF1544_12334 [Mucor circinelloides 1006PhL]|uniref:Uncharacterized protein n=1 Tax=Mucor circinelloides f. circinelloides (strain 1006PhL) TaxID=1220926 RepID=S2IUL8_MUCC1|nr:hypothetical protein HMPREF1544_12334 [Mucor circinelloides 1006PhL]